jgi:hypothetical protein
VKIFRGAVYRRVADSNAEKSQLGHRAKLLPGR